MMRWKTRSGTDSRFPLLALCVAALALAALGGCGQAAEDKHADAPAKLEPTQQEGVKRIALTQRAVERLGIELAEVTLSDGKLEAPYSALIYDASGAEWIYISPEPLVFVRARVEVEQFEQDRIVMSRGPAAGTAVVTVGAAELLGAEAGL